LDRAAASDQYHNVAKGHYAGYQFMSIKKAAVLDYGSYLEIRIDRSILGIQRPAWSAVLGPIVAEQEC
jgi:hypothetical protein